MKKLFSIFRTSGALLLFSLIFSSACQPAQPSPSATPISTIPSPQASTPTDTTLFSLPTPTAPPIATAQPTVTNTPAPLSSEGPWLVYNRYNIVNQDGTGLKQVKSDCDIVNIRESSSNRLMVFPGLVHLFQPDIGMLSPIYSVWPPCNSDFTGDAKSGLLASVYGRDTDSEVRIYELPGGKMRDQFPLFNCLNPNETCLDGMSWWGSGVKWSPNGRYLAFAAVLDGPSSDLYVYDVHNGSKRRLTSGPDRVGPFWWSPDGSWIIMAEALYDYAPTISSLWAVSVSNGEIRLLSKPEDGYNALGILGWLDARKFIVYGGTSLYDASDLPAYNIYLVDTDTSQITMLYHGGFYTADFVTDLQMIVLGVYDPEPGQGYQGPGTYLVPASNPIPRFVGQDIYRPNWDSRLKLFVTDRSCENDPHGKLAFNTQAEWQCIYPPDSYSSPDRQWQVSIRNGTWLKTNDQQPVQIFQGDATQVIWRLDSAGFFLLAERTSAAEQNLYYVSLPEATLTLIDRYMQEPMVYQWLEK